MRFEESVFWVVTRGLRCFYCMEHCEMLMEVGGLQYAHQLTCDPQSVTCADFQLLVKSLGKERALDCVWWICRCHLMTKVSDAFQLALEGENVFARYARHPK